MRLTPISFPLMSHVVLAVSGGVDSTVAATLLMQAGHRVTGVFMSHPWQLPHEADEAIATAERLGIECHVVDFTKAFEKLVEYFADEYFAARTPNPCALCNREIKFGLLFETMQQLGGDYLATGHYIRRMTHEQWYDSHGNLHDNNDADAISESLLGCFDANIPAICRGHDPGKDQSYIMFSVARDKLSRLMFPVGGYEKAAIRELAMQSGFDFSQKRESQEICFVPDHEHVRFINELRPDQATTGNLVAVDGTILGTHEGFEHFTIGQRKGMRVGFGERRYVVRLDATNGDVVIGSRDDLARSELTASQCNWLISPPQEPFRCRVKIRYRSPATPATVTPLNGGSHMHVAFEESRHAVAPGQVAACYLGDRILGGGWID